MIGSFRQFIKQDQVNEMAGKKGKMYHTSPPKEEDKLIITGTIGAAGHQQPGFRTGSHQDKRKRRLRTRNAEQRGTIGDYS